MSDFIHRSACRSHDFAILKLFPRPRRSDVSEFNIVELIIPNRKALRSRGTGQEPQSLLGHSCQISGGVAKVIRKGMVVGCYPSMGLVKYARQAFLRQVGFFPDAHSLP